MATKTTQSAGATTRRRQRTTNGNGSAASRKQQAERFAQQSRKKVDERREKATGAAGWVADRAGDWSLDAQDLRFMELQKFLWNPLIDYWFRMDVEGWENIPEPPALLVGIHSGAPFVWDAWTVGIHWWRRFGKERVLHGTAHDALMATPLIGSYFRKMGVLPAAPDSMSSAVAAQLLPKGGRPPRCPRRQGPGVGGGPRRRGLAGRRGRLAAPVDQARQG